MWLWWVPREVHGKNGKIRENGSVSLLCLSWLSFSLILLHVAEKILINSLVSIILRILILSFPFSGSYLVAKVASLCHHRGGKVGDRRDRCRRGSKPRQ